MRNFRREKLVEVRYAVDDAIDLAYLFAFDAKVALVQPRRIVLALSGKPEKAESVERLKTLTEAGAVVESAGHTDVLALLESQAQTVGPNGILIAAFATHGFMGAQGNQYLVAGDSMLRHPETLLKDVKIRDLASRSDARRSLVLIDACRERMTVTRGAAPEPMLAAPPLRPIRGVVGQAVLSAAGAGGYAYDDDVRRNGVFTAAVLDGLSCGASVDPEGRITAPALGTFVNGRVTAWIRKYRDPNVEEGIQIHYDGGMLDMALATCGTTAKPGLAPRVPVNAEPAIVRIAEGSFSVLSDDGFRLWGGRVDGMVRRGVVADLDGDGKREVVIGVEHGQDSGKIFAFGGDGKKLWVADTTLPYNYGVARSGRMAITDLVTAELFQKGKRQVIAVAIDSQGWLDSNLTVFDQNGQRIGLYWHPGHLHKVIAGPIDPGGKVRIVAAGVTNSFTTAPRGAGYLAVVFLLDPADVRGEAPPHEGLADEGSQLWYGFITPQGQTVQRLELVDGDQDGQNEISVWTSTNHIFYLDVAGNVMSRSAADSATGNASFSLLGDIVSP
ncbi:MAG TPA: hypothetical protein VGQ76_14235 [Thermoanaerobaculia bacterium]|nr:hypothetical protein [Thermoanaerobaculia bacterium]